jgi:hypothetical protein
MTKLFAETISAAALFEVKLARLSFVIFFNDRKLVASPL